MILKPMASVLKEWEVLKIEFRSAAQSTKRIEGLHQGTDLPVAMHNPSDHPVLLPVQTFNAVIFERGQRFTTVELGTRAFGRYLWLSGLDLWACRGWKSSHRISA